MENKSHFIVAICFLVIFSVGAIIFFLWLSMEKPATRMYEVVTSKSVSGLHGQAPVKFKGLTAGKVRSVQYDPDNPNKVRILFAVYDRIPITTSTYAQVGSEGLIGTTVLTLKNPKPGAKALKTSSQHPQHIPLRPTFMDHIKSSVSNDVDKVSSILDKANQVLDSSNRKQISRIITQVNEATRQLVKAEKAVMPALQNMPEVSREAQANLKASKKLIRQMQELIAHARKPVKKAADVEDSVQSLTQSARKLSRKLNNQTLPNVDRLTQHIQQAVDRLNALGRELQRKPQSVLFGPPKQAPGPGEPGFDDSHGGNSD